MRKLSKPSTNFHEYTDIRPAIRLFVAFHSWMVFIVGQPCAVILMTVTNSREGDELLCENSLSAIKLIRTDGFAIL